MNGRISLIYQSLIYKISSITGLNIYGSAIFLFILAIYIALLIILGFVYKLIKKYYKNKEEKFVLECDQIIAKFAKEQYNNKHPKNINILLIESIFSSKTKNYFNEKETFISKLKEIEINIGKNILEDNQISRLEKLYKKIKILKLITQFIGRIITILTLGIGKIFI